MVVTDFLFEAITIGSLSLLSEALGLYRPAPERSHMIKPVILQRDDWSEWLDGAPDDAPPLCRPYPDLQVKSATAEHGVRRSAG